MKASMGKLGLRVEQGLQCPAGDYHEIAAQRLAILAAQGGGTAACVKCSQVLTLSRG